MDNHQGSEVIQKLILKQIDRDGYIPDTRTLKSDKGEIFEGQAVLGVLRRLAGHEVNYA